MNIQNIFDGLKIMPQLQLHMFRVAGVASIISNRFREKVDKKSIVTACLLHDVGNIIKFDLTAFPESLKPRGLNYWKGVQNEYIKSYGRDDHKATLKIVRKLEISKEVIALVASFGFRNAQKLFKSSYDKKICVYSDMRVAPNGVTSLEERLKDARHRYVDIKKKLTNQKFSFYENYWQKIEEQVFFRADIKPEEVTERKVMQLVLELKDFDIMTK